jgi:hypothetical protein
MTQAEVMDLVVASLVRAGAGDVAGEALEAASFGKRPGFRFSLKFLTHEGLEMRGAARGIIADGKLYLILYLAERSHYYDKHAPQVERMLESIETS